MVFFSLFELCTCASRLINLLVSDFDKSVLRELASWRKVRKWEKALCVSYLNSCFETGG